jgi:alpha-1,2-mannosyltransferase
VTPVGAPPGASPVPSAGTNATPPLLVAAAIVVPCLTTATILLVAGDTLGYDFRAYLDAARRLLDGAPLYDTTIDVAGAFSIYLYPPPFAVALAPLALLPGTTAPTLAWLAASIAALVGAIAALPVRPWVRWTVLLVAGVTWPVLYTLKLGQVGPVLLLCFALAWRWIDRPVGLGLSIAAGTLVKLQPALLIPWALVTRRWRAATVASVTVLVACAASVPFVGLDAWADYARLIRGVGAAVDTPHAVSPGAILLGLGVDPAVASVLQWVTVLAVAALTVHAWLRLDAEASLVVTAVASQCLSPLVWDHYAIVLLLPVALVLGRLGRRAWPIALLPIAGWLPAPVYPLLFAIGLVSAWAVGRRRPFVPATPASSPAPAGSSSAG